MIENTDNGIARYHAMAEHSPLPIAITAREDHVFSFVNLVFCQMLGIDPIALHGRPFGDAIPGFATDQLRELLDQVYQTGVPALSVEPLPILVGPDLIYWNYTIWPITDDQRRSIGLVFLVRNTTISHHNDQALIDIRTLNEQLLISSLHNLEIAEQLRQQLAFAAAIPTSLIEGLYMLDCTGKFTMVNRTAEQLLGWTEAELLGQSAYEVVHGLIATSVGSVPSNVSPWASICLHPSAYEPNARWTRRDGVEFPAAYSMSPIRVDTQVAGVVVIFRDMTVAQQVALTLAQQARALALSRTELEQALADVQKLALIDDLTGLYNRRGFLTLAAQQMKFSKRTKQAVSLIFIDLDDLKSINDRFGHTIGSQAIAGMAHILTATFRASDIIARYGDDEFVVIAMDSDAPDQHQVLQRLHDQCVQHNRQANVPYQLSFSIGVAYSTAEQPYTLEELLAQADLHMYAHKQTKHTRT